MDLKAEAQALQLQLVAWRRDFHRHPELGFKEVRTSGIVAKHLANLGLEVQIGIGKTGVVGVLDGVKPGPVVMLRFDMDALPIQELNQTDYVSQTEGVMHACGHDAHTAIGLGVAQLMVKHRDEISGTLKFVFQPAEEGENGALAMIRDGVLNDPAPDIALGLHVWNEAPVGVAHVGAGSVMAAADIFAIKVQGKGTHGAQPHRGVDPILLAAHIVTALQTVVARNVNPRQTAVVTVGTLHAGSAFNIIADIAEMTGTIRTFDPLVREQILQRVQGVVEGTAAALGGSATIEIKAISPATVNDARVAQLVRETAIDVMGAANVSADQFTMGAEDMSEFLNRVPGCFFFLGSANADKGPVYPYHNPRYDIDEAILPDGVAILAGAALRYLNGDNG
ncbi:MAG: amidohydrolase [Chloroflexi bacterium]|nr:amidohydrolase [Chloroflexota bacterium]